MYGTRIILCSAVVQKKKKKIINIRSRKILKPLFIRYFIDSLLRGDWYNLFSLLFSTFPGFRSCVALKLFYVTSGHQEETGILLGGDFF